MAARRCDHDPRQPRLELVARVAPNVPKIIRDAIDRCARIYHRPNTFPELTGASLAGGRARIRKRRSSRLEAIALVAAALIRRGDRRTLRVGDQRDDGLCNGVVRLKLMEQTGLNLPRLVRAIREGEEAAYWKSDQAVEEYADPETGEKRYRGFPAVRVLTPLLFQRLGISPRKLKKARARGYQEWTTRKARPLSPVAILGTRRELRRFTAAAAPAAPRLPSRYYELELAVKAKHPEWGLDRVRAEARRLLRRP